MNKKRYIRFSIIIILALAATGILSGWQLAVGEETDIDSSDQLCGVYVTFGYPQQELELTNDDILTSMDHKGKPVLDASSLIHSSNYQLEGKLTSKGDKVVFKGGKGYFMGLINQPTDNGEDSIGMIADPEFTENSLAVKNIDNTEENICSSSIYVTPNMHDAFFLNPVYRRMDGSYYAVLGNSTGSSFSGNGSDVTCTQSLDNTASSIIGKKKSFMKIGFKVTVKVVDEVLGMKLKEMNAKDELIKVTTVNENSPEEYIVDDRTSYVIVEEITKKSGLEQGIKRTAYTPLPRKLDEISNQHSCSFAGKDGIVDQKKIIFMTAK